MAVLAERPKQDDGRPECSRLAAAAYFEAGRFGCEGKGDVRRNGRGVRQLKRHFDDVEDMDDTESDTRIDGVVSSVT